MNRGTASVYHFKCCLGQGKSFNTSSNSVVVSKDADANAIVISMEIGLVLSGGGARGFAHIGVFKALEEYNLKPVAIAGCSMGAIIGAFYGAGFNAAKMQAVTEEINFLKLLHLGELGGLVGGKGIQGLLSKHLPETFADLSLPLSVTAVDVQIGSLVVLNSGLLIPGLRATSALPGLLSPVKHEGRYLVDGGLLNNLPVDIIRTMTLKPIVAVDIASPPHRKLEFEPSKPSMLENFHALITGKKNPIADLLERGLTMELFMKSFDVPQRVLTEMRLSMQPPELLIRPELDSQFGVEDFFRANEAIEQGYVAAQAAIQYWQSTTDG